MPSGVFRNDPRLTDEEIQTIVAWIDGGAPEGDKADMPMMPALADGWTIGKPDAVYPMTEDYRIEVVAHYDNSPGNKYNPDPTKDVKWGDQTWEEMMIGFWGSVVDAPAASQ
jgi:hypothetical protein